MRGRKKIWNINFMFFFQPKKNVARMNSKINRVHYFAVNSIMCVLSLYGRIFKDEKKTNKVRGDNVREVVRA